MVKADTINFVLRVLGIMSVFFAGYLLESLFYLALFLFFCGVIVLCVQAVPTKEEGE